MAELNGLPHRRSTPTRYGWLLGAFATLVVLSAALSLSLAPMARAPIVDLLEHVLVRGTSGKYAKLQFSLYDTMYPKSVAWSPDGKYIATEDRDVHIWNVQQRKIIKVLPLPFPAPWFHELAFSPDGKYLAACDGTGVLRIYRTRLWTTVHVFSELHGSGGSCDHPVFSSDSQRIVAGPPGDLTVISVPDWRVVKHLVLDSGWGRGDRFNAVAFLPGTHTVLVGGGQVVKIPFFGKMQDSSEGQVWFFDPADQVPSRAIRAYRPAGDHGGGANVTSMTTSPDGRYLVTVTKTGSGTEATGTLTTQSVHVFRVSDGSLVAAPLDGLPPIKFAGGEAIAYTHNGRYIIVPHDTASGWIHVLDGRTFKVLDLVQSHAFTFDVAVNAVNDDFAVATGRKVMVWSLPDR